MRLLSVSTALCLVCVLVQAQPSVLPRQDLTPGIADPSVSAEQLRHPSFIRKRRNVPLAEKKLVLQRYGIPWSQHRLYEIDHDLPLCLGGMNTISNLWPEPWAGPYGAKFKDRLEVYLHRRVNKGQMTLQEAQACFLTEPWTNAYNRAGFKPGLKQRVFSITHRPVK